MKTYIVHWKSKTISSHTGVVKIKAKSKDAAKILVENKFNSTVSQVFILNKK